MSHKLFCQSCGMPMDAPDAPWGTETDGSASADYCRYCYQNGAFTFEGDMDVMIEKCVPHFLTAHPEATEVSTRELLRQFYPNLKRWRKEDDLEKLAVGLLEKCRVVSLASIDENGYPRPCIVAKLAVNDGIRKIYIATGTSSRKTAHFRACPKAGLSFGLDHDAVTLTGDVRILDDPAERAAHWEDWMKAHFPDGPSDPEYTILEFNLHQAVYYINSRFETVNY